MGGDGMVAHRAAWTGLPRRSDSLSRRSGDRSVVSPVWRRCPQGRIPVGARGVVPLELEAVLEREIAIAGLAVARGRLVLGVQQRESHRLLHVAVGARED